MSTDFEFCDALGPEKIISIYDPDAGLHAYLAVDNTAAGPAIGGVRMASDITADECFRLARAMTLKNAMAGLAHGGGKAGIVADPNQPADEKTRLIRAFAYAIKDIQDYIPGPDMGTNETAMAQVHGITGRAVGLPRTLGGIPLDQIGATGFGLSVALEVAQEFTDVKLANATVVIEGFGSVGQHAARFLAQQGASIVAVADSGGARHCAEGFDLAELLAHKLAGQSVAHFRQGKQIEPGDLVAVDCDVWIPAARPDVIDMSNVSRMRTKIVIEGANIPVTLPAEQYLVEQGVLVIPDFVANAGGVICAAVEYHQGSEQQALAVIEEKIAANVEQVLNEAVRQGVSPRTAASEIARSRIQEAMSYRRSW
jgi:glutamate dehydrogenase/leucine dehydrogenase